MRLLKKLTVNVSDEQTVQETSEDHIITRRRNNVQSIANVRLVWLDNNIDMNNTDCQNTIKKLQHAVNLISTFTNGEECIQFLETIKNENVYVIVSGALGQGILPQLNHMSQVDTIFIFCSEKEYHQQWVKHWSKINGVFTDIDLICEALRQAAQQCEQNSISISFMATTGDMTSKKLNQLEPSFMYTQIMKEILLSITFEEQHFQEFVDYCSEVLRNNPGQLQNLNKIKRKYREETPIWWYTYECFLYPMLNRALRTLDADLMITLGFFIKDLHLQIDQLYKEQFDSLNSNKSFIVYRGQGMMKEEFDKMMETKGGLLSFNCFLSTSKKKEISLVFAERAAATNANLVGILFVMSIDSSQSTTPFAGIGRVSYYKNQEEEVLFSMNTVFRIDDITSMDETQGLFQVNLTLTSDHDPDLRALTDRIREETFPEEEGWYRLGMTLLKLGEWKKAEEVYEVLLEGVTTEKEKAHIYHRIGWTKNDRLEFAEAIQWYEKSIEIKEKIFSPDDPDLAMSYNNIGNAYNGMREHSKALSSHEKALAMRQQSLPPNHLDVAMSHGNMGNVYNDMGEYSTALVYYENALAIRQQSLPPNHPHLAMSYIDIGSVYANMGEYSKALSSHEKALSIQQQSLPRNHPYLAMSHGNMANVYSDMGEYSEALSSYAKVLEIDQKSLPPNHPHLAAIYDNIGNLYDKMGEYSKALSSYEKALSIRQQSLPSNHPDLAMSYNNIGVVYDNIGDSVKARSFYEQAVKTAQQSLPAYHPHRQMYENNLDRIKKKM